MNRKGNAVLWIVLAAVTILLFVVGFVRPDSWYFHTATIEKAAIASTWPHDYQQNFGDATSGFHHAIGFCEHNGVISQTISPDSFTRDIFDQDKIFIFKYLGVFDPQWCAGDSLLSEVSS